MRAGELFVALDCVSLDVFPQTFLALCLETANVTIKHLARIPVFEMNLLIEQKMMNQLKESYSNVLPGSHDA